VSNAADRPRRVNVDRDGPILIEGPVEIVAADGSVASSDRFVVALCTCRRSRSYPWCDTSHRAHKRPSAERHAPQASHAPRPSEVSQAPEATDAPGNEASKDEASPSSDPGVGHDGDHH
jgi:CDGSH-type Zn-finger protein